MTSAKEKVLNHYINNPGVAAHWETMGVDYKSGDAAIDELINEGKLEWRKVPSKSGKTMREKLFATGA